MSTYTTFVVGNPLPGTEVREKIDMLTPKATVIRYALRFSCSASEKPDGRFIRPDGKLTCFAL
jgi:hypothetical protein